MAVGIIDRQTGAQHIRRLSWPVAIHAVNGDDRDDWRRCGGGRALLNGFLSKDMLFAETIEIHGNSLIDQALLARRPSTAMDPDGNPCVNVPGSLIPRICRSAFR